MLKIFYFPFSNETNLYCERMKELLSTFGEVNKVDKKKLLLDFFLFRRKDFLFLNWFENCIINRSGNISYFGILKVFVCFFIFRIVFRNFIFVRHNHYPHDCLSKNSKKARYIINMLEMISHKVIVHSPLEVSNKNRIYVPHPLYNNPASEIINVERNVFVIFGRIIRYKKIEEVINLFPENMKLIVVGKCEDDSYLKELQEIISLKSNIQIFNKFMSDIEITEIVKNSQGMLITHNNEDMIVSGSFFYGLSLNSKIYCLSTPFLTWVETELGSKYIEVYDSLESMIQGFKKIDSKVVERENVYSLFGDHTIVNILKCNFFDD